MPKTIKCAVINYMEPLPSECGRKWRSHQIANILSKKGFKTHLFTSSFSHFYGYQRGFKNKLLKNYIVNFCLASSYSRRSIFRRIISQIIFSISLLIKIFCFRPSIIFASYPHSFSLIAITFLKPFLKYKLIIDIRDSLKQPSKNLLARTYCTMEKLLSFIWVLNSDILIGPGEKVFLYLPNKLKSKAKERYINIPMTYENNFLNKNLVSNEKTNFIFIGSLSKAFDLENLIDFFIKKDDSINFWILGDGPFLEKYKFKYSSQKNIQFLGQVGFKTIKLYAAKSKFGLMPYSEKDNRFAHHLTNKLGEYLSFGILPLIPNHCYEMSSFVRKNSCGIVYDSKNLSKFLDELIYKNRKNSRLHLQLIHKKYLSHQSLVNSINKLIKEII